MHRTTATRSHWRPGAGRTLALSLTLSGTRALEDRLPANRKSGACTCACARWLRTRCGWRWCGVNRTGSCLRNDHATRRCSALRRTSSSGTLLRGRWSFGRGWSLCRRSWCLGWRLSDFRLRRFDLFNGCGGNRRRSFWVGDRSFVYRRLHDWRRRLFYPGRWHDDGRGTLRCNACRRDEPWLRFGRGRLGRRRSGLGDHRFGGRCGGVHRCLGRLSRFRGGRTRCNGRLRRLLGDGLQHIAGLRNLRKVYLGLELVRGYRAPARVARRTAALLSRKVCFYTLGFVRFDRTGMRFLFRNAHLQQDVKDCLAFDFQFPSQIVDSNLHPTFVSSAVPTIR
jgi:hypothetical protein